MTISATIVTLNEELNIARAIQSLTCADEIVVVDSGSSDRTREIAASLGARVIEEPWRGYAAQKNFASGCALYDWILSIDADEELTPVLAAEIAALKTSEPKCDGYSMPRKARYLGRWIHHGGWYPDRKPRLYRRDRAAWVGAYVHESVQVNGTVVELTSDLLHYTCDTLAAHVTTLNQYTTLAAAEMAEGGDKPGIVRSVVAAKWTFFRTYILRAGFLDGRPGFLLAAMAAWYTFLKYVKAGR